MKKNKIYQKIAGTPTAPTQSQDVAALQRRIIELEAAASQNKKSQITEMDDMSSAWLLRQLSLTFNCVPNEAFKRVAEAVVKEINLLINEGILHEKS